MSWAECYLRSGEMACWKLSVLPVRHRWACHFLVANDLRFCDRCEYHEYEVRNHAKHHSFVFICRVTPVSVSTLVDQLTNVERIANTPLPKSCMFPFQPFYSCIDEAELILDGIHLKQCVTLYLFALPFTLVKELGWATVPIVTVVSFTLMGIEGIAEEIEMPFGKHVYSCYATDSNLSGPCAGLDEGDLPLGESPASSWVPLANSMYGLQNAIART